MKKKQNTSRQHGSNGFDHLASSADFYAGSPSERPLHQDGPASDLNRVRKTARHQAVAGRRKETVDPREKMALLAVLRAAIVVILLIIAFFMLWKGIKIYEESVWMENQTAAEVSPVMREVAMVDGFDIGAQTTGETFADRIEVWKQSERLVGAVDELLLRNHYDQAIERCQDALELDPTHMGALERLGRLYFEKGMFVEAVNTYIRLLSVAPSRDDLQLALLKSLNAYGDPDATIAVAHWYQDRNTYNEDVQRYMANAYFQQEKYSEAATAYARVLKDSPRNAEALENQAVSYMRLQRYDDALAALNQLVAINYRDQNCYKWVAICHAQLGKGLETVQTLGKAAHLFGQNTVVGWVQDPLLDPIRMDRTFQAFADRVGGEEFRKYLEQMAQTMENEKTKEVAPLLSLPERQALDSELLKPQQ